MTKQAEYLKKFETLPPAEQDLHIAVIVRYLLKLIEEQESVQPNPLNKGAIELKSNVRLLEAK